MCVPLGKSTEYISDVYLTRMGSTLSRDDKAGTQSGVGPGQQAGSSQCGTGCVRTEHVSRIAGHDSTRMTSTASSDELALRRMAVPATATGEQPGYANVRRAAEQLLGPPTKIQDTQGGGACLMLSRGLVYPAAVQYAFYTDAVPRMIPTYNVCP